MLLALLITACYPVTSKIPTGISGTCSGTKINTGVNTR
jgi:hypothetical protein